MKKYTLTIENKRFETEDTITLSFRQPRLRKINYQSGQYISLILNINGRKYIRPYSLSSSPTIDVSIDITVKRVKNGVVSNFIVDCLEVGDVIEVMEPMGDFVFKSEPQHLNFPIILWAAGSGITPLFSIIKDILSNQADQRPIILVYGNRESTRFIFKYQLQALLDNYSERFEMINFFSKHITSMQNSDRQFLGRISPELVFEILENRFLLENSLHYICGPIGLKNSVIESLSKRGIPNNQIFFEDFELVINKKDLEDIVDRTISLVQQGNSLDIHVEKGKSILEAGLDANLDLPYSCQTGNCSICKGKLISGIVRQILPKHSDLAEDEFQLCCTYPLTDNVVFNV